MKPYTPSILIVDDDEDILKILSRIIVKEGWNALTAADGEKAMAMIYLDAPDAVLLDIHMPGLDGMSFLKKIKDLYEDIPVIMITAYANIHQSVEAMRKGAHDYIAKPFDNHEVIRIVRRAFAERDLKRDLKQLMHEPDHSFNLKENMGPSDSVEQLIIDVQRVATSDFTVIVTGETGTGKELIARSIHLASQRSRAPFIPMDCGAITETLLESELFGHEKGAFTGAEKQKIGKFEVAAGGTLFMDEVSNIPLGSQARFLRVVQERKFYRVGGVNPVDTDVRLIVATNQDLQGLAASGLFRRDLFYRLNEFTITVPPLRDRKEDIPYLAKRFLDIANLELNKMITGFSDIALDALLNYNWPGNVRQMRSTIRRATLVATDEITENDLNIKRAAIPGMVFTPKVEGIPWKNASMGEIVQKSTLAVEREVLTQALRYTGGNKAKAARLLQIDNKTIYTKVKKFGINFRGNSNDKAEAR
jgi:DNA-binding NtrC family response regulator